MDIFYVDVLIDSLQFDLDREQTFFTYSVPANLKEKVKPGSPVIVPLKDMQVGGYVIKISDTPPLNIECKPIFTLLDSIFENEFIELLKWVSDYYFCSIKNVIQSAIPSGLLTKIRKNVKVTVDCSIFDEVLSSQTIKNPAFYRLCNYLKNNVNKEISILSLKYKFGGDITRYLRRLQDIGIITIKTDIILPEIKGKQMLHAMIISTEAKNLTPKQSQALETLIKYGGSLPVKDLMKITNSSKVVIEGLKKAGCINLYKERIFREPLEALYTDSEIKELTYHQKAAILEIEKMLNTPCAYRPLLLYGVTGSGKTEVYIQGCERVIKQGGTALVLVPEIGMTPQILGKFKERFKNNIGILHSALSKGERIDEWQKIKAGVYKIVIGARSAVFAPLKNLQLIIIDEEHDTSYKQETTPRYHARTVALKRAELCNAIFIMGTATPAVETYYNAINGSTEIIVMPKRVQNRPLPEVKIIDMSVEFKQGNRTIFSRELKSAIQERLVRNEQTILFLNRRGYSTYVFCRTCGNSLNCPNCSVALVYHIQQNVPILRCHYCDYTLSMPKTCPVCQSVYIKHFGTGTQKIEELTIKEFPDAVVQRLDSDTTGKKHAHKDILEKLKNHEIDILIGTQMVAKGLDFPSVTLVGSLVADSFLNMPDFRANERTFQLLTQVAGRAGRGDSLSEVIIQTYVPEHKSILTAKNHDFLTFFNQEIESRKELKYPPFSQLINIVTASAHSNTAMQYSQNFANYFKEWENIDSAVYAVLGPVPALISKIRNYYRWQILIKCKDLSIVRTYIKQIINNINYPKDIRLTVDIEPMNML